MKKLNALSLFNGMSFGMMALETCGIEVDKYYSSEIDKYANQATKALYPDIIQLGDVTKWRQWDIDWAIIDLLLAGFPCQAWSIAGKQEGDNDPRGALVHDLIAIWQHINLKRYVAGKKPVKFMFENVKMKKEFLDYINELFGVEPVCINSALVSAQNRVRYYWTNIGEVEQPEDKGIILADIIHGGITGLEKLNKVKQVKSIKGGGQGNRVYSTCGKSCCLNAQSGGTAGNGNLLIEQTPRGNNPGGLRALNGKAPCVGANSWQENNKLTDGARHRKLTPRECMRLQTVPESHITTLLNAGISNTQLYKMNGNGWTHDVIVHIFKGLLQ